MIAIVDYQAGNLASVKRAFDRLGADAVVCSNAAAIARADKLVLPGVGHFAATRALSRNGMRAAIEKAIAVGKPFLGICLGMQWMFEGSSEAPDVAGLAAVAGRCSRFDPGAKVPHVGWNQVRRLGTSKLLQGIGSDTFVYYSHSYRAHVNRETVAVTDYNGPFAAVLELGNLFGVQFHPEKSGDAGLRVLRNFVEFP